MVQSPIESAEEHGALETTEAAAYRERDVDQMFACGQWHVIQVELSLSFNPLVLGLSGGGVSSRHGTATA
jgi:hypothetical protein